MAGFGERLRKAIKARDLTQERLAVMAGVEQASISDMLTRDEPSKHTVALAMALDVRPRWLAFGHGEMDLVPDDWGIEVVRQAITQMPPPAPQAAPAEALADDFVLVPRYDVQASAGPGALTAEENVLDHMAFRRAWVRSTLGVEPSRLALLTAVGDSMEPSIRAGDLLLVDTGVDRVIDDSIYVLIKEGWVVVKRLQRFFNGAVIVKSDNTRYVEETVGPEELDELHVAGRVRWIGRMI